MRLAKRLALRALWASAATPCLAAALVLLDETIKFVYHPTLHGAANLIIGLALLAIPVFIFLPALYLYIQGQE